MKDIQIFHSFIEGMKAIEEANKKTTGKLIPVEIDVTSEESVQNAVRFVRENLDSKLSVLNLLKLI